MKRIKNPFIILGMITTIVATSCSRTSYTNNNADAFSNHSVLMWNETAYQAFGGSGYQHSLMAARINAMVHIAMHDAINAIHPRYATYTFNGKDPKAHPLAAAASAAHTVLLHEIPGKKSLLDSALQESLLQIPESDAKNRGITLGRLAGEAIVAERSNDGAAANPVVAIPPAKVPGDYKAVPPFDFYFAPFWENVKLFGLERKDQFRCVEPPALNSDNYTAAFNEVKEYGKLNSTARTNEQTFYAKYWYEFSEAGWNRVARKIAVSRKLNLYETARMFALVDMAMADAYTAGWDSKIHYNLWRPYTAIREAQNDGNDQTNADTEWEPEMVTPPIQDYPSTHSALGNAAAVVMASIVGDDSPFEMESPSAIPAGSTRTFSSLSEAAKENADSRVKAGIHFRFACDAGLELGKQIGDYIIRTHLKPL